MWFIHVREDQQSRIQALEEAGFDLVHALQADEGDLSLDPYVGLPGPTFDASQLSTTEEQPANSAASARIGTNDLMFQNPPRRLPKQMGRITYLSETFGKRAFSTVLSSCAQTPKPT